MLTRITLRMYPLSSCDGNMDALLDAFEADEKFAPTHWGGDERVRLEYKREDVVRHAKRPLAAVYLYRDKAAKYGGGIDVSQASLNFEIDKSIAPGRWPEFLRLADRMASVVKPGFGTAHIVWSSTVPWVTEQDRIHRWMNFCAQCAPKDFRPNGPLGLALRTYFGGEILELFGRDLLLKTPIAVEELDWGGIRMDLAENMWDAKLEFLLERWMKAMDHLKPAEAMAVPHFLGDRRTIKFTPSPAWSRT